MLGSGDSVLLLLRLFLLLGGSYVACVRRGPGPPHWLSCLLPAIAALRKAMHIYSVAKASNALPQGVRPNDTVYEICASYALLQALRT